MGALELAPILSTWIPEDDLLLKNTIEAGASLESLAKGAVQFSRKFTIRELQDRWHSLLYDPVVSKEASSRIIEFERSAPSLPSKLGRIGNSKDNKSLLGKRNSESVRSCYYALRKRIRNEPFNSMDLSFLVAPSDGNYVGTEDEPLPGNCMLGNPISDHFGVQETNMNIMNCSFPQILADDVAAVRDDCTTDGFQTANFNQDDGGFPVEQSGSGIEELHESKELSVDGLFDANGLMGKPSSAFDQINNDPENIFSEFEGNQVFNSPMDCGLSIWGTGEGLSASAIPADGHGETDLQGGDIYALPSEIVAKSDHSSGHVVTTDFKLETGMPSDEVENKTADMEGYLVEITNTLMNDEPFFMDVDSKDVIDKSYFDGLSSFLASSPNTCDQDQMPDVTEAMTSEMQDNLANVSCSHLGELDGVAGSCVADGSVPFDSEVPMLSSVLTSNSRFPEWTDGVICCTLNTEDPEIPCNEGDVFSEQLCPSVVSSTQHIFKEAGDPLSACAKDFSRGQKTSDGGPLLVQRDQRDPGQSHGSSQMKESQMIPEMGQLHPVGNCKVKCEDSPCVAPKSNGFLANGSAQINSKNISEGTLHPTLQMEKSENIIPGKHLSHCSVDSLREKPGLCSDNHNGYSLVNSLAIKQEVDAHEKAKDHQASSAEMGSMDIIFPEPVVDHPPLDLEELVIESDDDIPYFSDIEAMILDMDLDPDDQDSGDREVARYQHEDMKRAILRLEQASHSYMQRAIASHEDFVVDIDLGSEGCANKVSRRQAIINMEEDGSFNLKNLGKCSVSINGKEVAPGQSLGLNSSCLIEIRGMPFIFEMNQTCVKQYLNGKMSC
ncbi:hypothetical protein V6N13_049272 [Hibiscus sabdariffa]|uniref:Microspherule protein N-terminal domain-containing protein n=1 Tax=Hibiscus sabdariffa TaxID=183260 RepID=A0ABR2QYE7_9ROSI